MQAKYHRKEALYVRIFLSFSALLSLLLTAFGCKRPPDRTPPVIHGVQDIFIYVGEGVPYRAGISAADDRDGRIDFEVIHDAVDHRTPGKYPILYRATDSSGNVTELTATVTVLKPSVSLDLLFNLADQALASSFSDLQDRQKTCEELYYHVKAAMTYTGDSDKSDWKNEAYRGFMQGSGDCFTYYAVARVFFERLNYEYLTVKRAPGLLSTTHYWFLINMGSNEAPRWYHWDCCPHDREAPFKSCLLTDEELLAYNEIAPHYYSFDRALYPKTPTEPYKP